MYNGVIDLQRYELCSGTSLVADLRYKESDLQHVILCKYCHVRNEYKNSHCISCGAALWEDANAQK